MSNSINDDCFRHLYDEDSACGLLGNLPNDSHHQESPDDANEGETHEETIETKKPRFTTSAFSGSQRGYKAMGMKGFGSTHDKFKSFVATRGSKGTSGEGTRSSAYWNEDNPVMREYKFNRMTVNIPVLAPYTERKDIKNQIHQTIVQTIARANASWADKADGLEQIFMEMTPGAATVAATVMTGFADYSSAVYEFVQVALVDTAGNNLDLGNQAGVPADTRRDAAFIVIQLGVNPKNCTTTQALNIDTTKFPNASTCEACVMALLNGTGVLHTNITRNMMTTADQHKRIVGACNAANADFEMRKTGKHTTGPDPDEFQTWLTNIKNKTRFEALAQATKRYVGKVEGTQALPQRLQQISQRRWNAFRRSFEFDSVNKMHLRFQTVLREVDPAAPPADMPDLSGTFYQSLTEELKEKVVQHLPRGQPTSFQDNMGCLTELVNHCEEAEKNVKAVLRLVATTQGPRPQTTTTHQSQSGTAGRAFFAGTPKMMAFATNRFRTKHPHEEGDEPDTENNDPIEDGYGNEVIMPKTFLALATGDESNPDTTTAKTVIQAFTCLSAAEEALVQASGSRHPTECFGCGKTGHGFRQCPAKDDPKIVEQFYKRLREFNNNKRKQRQGAYGPNQGWPNERVYQKVQQIADPHTQAEARKDLLVTLAKNIDDHFNGKQESQVELEQVRSKKARTGSKKMSFLGCVIPETKRVTKGSTFSAIENQPDLQFSINSLLPFMLVPIGKEDDAGELKGLFDTGGCCNMGWLPYHTAIASRYPRLVQEIIELQKCSYEPIKIRGIEGHVKITHLIRCWLPYQTGQGTHHTLAIGLTETLPINTLYGLPFIIKAGLVPNFNKQIAVSQFFKDEFQVTMEKPQLVPLADLDHKEGLKKMFITTAETMMAHQIAEESGDEEDMMDEVA